MGSNIKKILVSQPAPNTEKSPYYDIAEKYGVKVVFRPFIKIDPVIAKEFRAQRVNILDYSAVVFTAKTAIDHFFRLSEELRIQIPETMKYFCVTEAIAVYLQKYIVFRKRKIFYPASGKMEDMVVYINKHNKEHFLVPVSDVHKEDLTKHLDEKKIKYNKAVMYRTVSNDFAPDEAFDYNILLFFSPAGIASLLKNFPDFDQDETAIGTFGPTTAKAVRDAGLRLDIEAPTPEAPSMTAALDRYLKIAINPVPKKHKSS
jgi:uroporphyrinogen-III synthase